MIELSIKMLWKYQIYLSVKLQQLIIKLFFISRDKLDKSIYLVCAWVKHRVTRQSFTKKAVSIFKKEMYLQYICVALVF